MHYVFDQEFQRALGSKQPTYDLVMKQGKEQLVKSTLENDTQTIGDMLTSLKSKWTSVCGKSVDRWVQVIYALFSWYLR